MPTFGPISRRDLIRYLKMLGFQGPFSGSRHAFMSKGDISLRIPNPHESDIGREFLARILRQAKISKEEWYGL
jgi:predicted RNA binding protein YcfA (HicA-like mRNA interferase family)